MSAHVKGRHISTALRLKPPPTLSAGASAVFMATVASVDPDHFSQVDAPLLEQYCVASDQARQAQHQLDAGGAVVDGKASPWLTVQEKSVRAMVALATKLRVCPMSRFDRLVAGANGRKQPEWDDDDDDDGLLAKSPEEEAALARRRADPLSEFRPARARSRA